MQRGDLFHVDCYGSYGGYFFDVARSRCVGDEPTDDQRALEAVIEGVETICAQIKPGMPADEVYRVGEAWMQQSPSSGASRGGARDGGLPRGMYLTVEILLGHPSIGGAMFEHNGLVTADGFEILTTARSRWW